MANNEESPTLPETWPAQAAMIMNQYMADKIDALLQILNEARYFRHDRVGVIHDGESTQKARRHQRELDRLIAEYETRYWEDAPPDGINLGSVRIPIRIVNELPDNVVATVHYDDTGNCILTYADAETGVHVKIVPVQGEEPPNEQ